MQFSIPEGTGHSFTAQTSSPEVQKHNWHGSTLGICSLSLYVFSRNTQSVGLDVVVVSSVDEAVVVSEAIISSDSVVVLDDISTTLGTVVSCSSSTLGDVLTCASVHGASSEMDSGVTLS